MAGGSYRYLSKRLTRSLRFDYSRYELMTSTPNCTDCVATVEGQVGRAASPEVSQERSLATDYLGRWLRDYCEAAKSGEPGRLALEAGRSTVLRSRTRPGGVAVTQPPSLAAERRPPTAGPRPRKRSRHRSAAARFGLVNRWNGLGYAPRGGHLRWLPEPAKDLVREVWELLPRRARRVTVAIWRLGRALRRSFKRGGMPAQG